MRRWEADHRAALGMQLGLDEFREHVSDVTDVLTGYESSSLICADLPSACHSRQRRAARVGSGLHLGFCSRPHGHSSVRDTSLFVFSFAH